MSAVSPVLDTRFTSAWYSSSTLSISSCPSCAHIITAVMPVGKAVLASFGPLYLYCCLMV